MSARAAVWLAGATAVFAAGLSSSHLPFRQAFHVPATPIDFTSGEIAPLWRFMSEVRGHLPEGASYTILEPGRDSHAGYGADDEMYLYMFSLGILDRQRGLPSSYFGRRFADGDKARFVIVYGGSIPATESARLVWSNAEGAVYERLASR